MKRTGKELQGVWKERNLRKTLFHLLLFIGLLRMADSRIAEIIVISDESNNNIGIDGNNIENNDIISSYRTSSSGYIDCQVVLSQLGISTHLQNFLKGSDYSQGSSTLYSDIIEDIKNMKGRTTTTTSSSSSSSSSSSISMEYNSYFGLSKISSCYRKHTQSSASQSTPLFKISFTGKSS